MFCQILYTKELHCRVNFLLHFGLPSNCILIGEGLKKFDTCIVMPANPLVFNHHPRVKGHCGDGIW